MTCVVSSSLLTYFDSGNIPLRSIEFKKCDSSQHKSVGSAHGRKWQNDDTYDSTSYIASKHQHMPGSPIKLALQLVFLCIASSMHEWSCWLAARDSRLCSSSSQQPFGRGLEAAPWTRLHPKHLRGVPGLFCILPAFLPLNAQVVLQTRRRSPRRSQ
jgi:hypothetical protein